MRRVFVLVAVAAAVAGALLLPAPEPAPEPLDGLVIEPPGLASPEEARIWYCPWAQADGFRDTVFGLASLESAVADFTLMVAAPGEPEDRAALEVAGRGAATLELSRVAVREDSPGFVEFSAGPAAVSATVSGDGMLAADACVPSLQSTWHFAGGSTMPGEELLLRIFNPYPEPAKVAVTAVSDIGVEALGMDNVLVEARTWHDIEFSTLLRQRQNLVVTVVAVDGVVVPAMSLRTEADEAWWPGAGEATVWEFPVARVQGTEAFLVVHNTGLGPVEVVVDLFTPEGPILEAFSGSVSPEAPARFDLSEFPGDPLAALVTASGPVTAAVVAVGEGEVAVMPGTPNLASTWLLPGLRRIPLHATSLWLLNTSSEEALSATVSALTATGSRGQTVVVPPGLPTQVDVTAVDALGFLVEASSPLSVAWTARGPDGLAFSSASPVGVPEE